MPVVPVDAAGFYGTKNLGNRIAGGCHGALCDWQPGARPIAAGSERTGIQVHDVNLVGNLTSPGNSGMFAAAG